MLKLEKRIKEEIKKKGIKGNVIEVKDIEEIAENCDTSMINVMMVLRYGRLL